jgi:hypothetical protein
MVQDAKRHGQNVAVVLLEQNGGILASSSMLIELRKVGFGLTNTQNDSLRSSCISRFTYPGY